MMKKFEYNLLKVVPYKLRKESFQADLDAQFQALGQKGWELVSSECIDANSGVSALIFIFKREIL